MTQLKKYESIHYTIILDDSGLMRGQKWEMAKLGVHYRMKEIEKNPYAKVSVIIFNKYTRVVINCEKVDIKKQEGKFNLVRTIQQQFQQRQFLKNCIFILS